MPFVLSLHEYASTVLISLDSTYCIDSELMCSEYASTNAREKCQLIHVDSLIFRIDCSSKSLMVILQYADQLSMIFRLRAIILRHDNVAFADLFIPDGTISVGLRARYSVSWAICAGFHFRSASL